MGDNRIGKQGTSAFNLDQLAKAARALETTPKDIISEADRAVKALGEIGVVVEEERSQNKNMAFAFLGAAVLGFLIAKAMSK